MLIAKKSRLRILMLETRFNLCACVTYRCKDTKEARSENIFALVKIPDQSQPYLLIVLLYNVSSIISSLLILYIVDKKTGKYFLNQNWLSLAAVNKFNQEWNWIILDMKYTSVLGLLVTLKSLFFNGLIAVTGHLYFICA